MGQIGTPSPPTCRRQRRDPASREHGTEVEPGEGAMHARMHVDTSQRRRLSISPSRAILRPFSKSAVAMITFYPPTSRA